MTEKTENAAGHNLNWPAFLGAFFAAPLLVTALTFWANYISYFALVLGGPVYVVFGLPLLIWYLRRNPPRIMPILLMSQVSLLGLLPLSVILAFWFDEWEALEALPAVIAFGAVFAILWSGTFALIYRWLTRTK